MTRITFNRPYDDPYAILAAHLTAVLSIKSLKKCLCNNAFVKSMVASEMKMLDIKGPFLDCIDQELISNDKLRKKNAMLNQLGEYYFSELDMPRLRAEIRKFTQEVGINLDDVKV